MADLRNALTAEKVFYTDYQRFTAESSELEAIEPSLRYTTDAAVLQKDPGVIYVEVQGAAAQTLVLGTRSESGRCWWVHEDTAAGTTYSGDPGCDPAAVTFGLARWPE